MLKYLEYLITNKLLDKKIIFKKIFKEKDLKQKNDRVFYSKSKNVYPDNQLIWLIYLYAKVNNILICRLCLHKSDKNKINSMIMIHVTNQIVGPLKQHKKYIAYHIIFGYIQIILNQKSKKNIFNLKSNGDNKNLLIPANEFRSIKSLSSPSIFLEIAEGPFKDSDTIWKT
jgi:cupin fold WbuC family metalloprotein